RSGHSLSTKALLEFQWAHARARDAVHRQWDAEALAQALQADGEKTLLARSRAASREVFLQRPDLGRQLDPESARLLNGARGSSVDLAICVSDGLSAAAIDRHFPS